MRPQKKAKRKITRFQNFQPIKNRLKTEGISDNQLSRLTAPVGLPMVSNTPEEIAISVAAQLLQLRNGKSN